MFTNYLHINIIVKIVCRKLYVNNKSELRKEITYLVLRGGEEWHIVRRSWPCLLSNFKNTLQEAVDHIYPLNDGLCT